MNRAVFLDRDGTVTEEVGYLKDISLLRLIPNAGTAIRTLNESGFKVILVTNQSGVARGFFPEALVHEAHEQLKNMLQLEGAHLDGIYHCPHHPTAGTSRYTMMCDCRKPSIGLIERAARDLSLDVKRSYVVGDKWSDVELGHRAGAFSVLVMSGYAADDPGNIRPPEVRDPAFTARDIFEAAAWIIRHAQADEG